MQAKASPRASTNYGLGQGQSAVFIVALGRLDWRVGWLDFQIATGVSVKRPNEQLVSASADRAGLDVKQTDDEVGHVLVVGVEPHPPQQLRHVSRHQCCHSSHRRLRYAQMARNETKPTREDAVGRVMRIAIRKHVPSR